MHSEEKQQHIEDGVRDVMEHFKLPRRGKETRDRIQRNWKPQRYFKGKLVNVSGCPKSNWNEIRDSVNDILIEDYGLALVPVSGGLGGYRLRIAKDQMIESHRKAKISKGMDGKMLREVRGLIDAGYGQGAAQALVERGIKPDEFDTRKDAGEARRLLEEERRKLLKAGTD